MGDTVTFTFGDGTAQTYTVGGILDGDIYSSTAIYGGWFLIPRELLPPKAGLFNASFKLVVDARNADLENVENKYNYHKHSNKKKGICHVAIYRNDLQTSEDDGIIREPFIICGKFNDNPYLGNCFGTPNDKYNDKYGRILFDLHISIWTVCCILLGNSADYCNDYFFCFLYYAKSFSC